MAAPVSPQGSRAGLITAVVIFVVLFVTSTIFAIYFGSNWQKSEEIYKQEVAKNAQVVNANDLATQDVQEYVQQAKRPEAAWNVLSRQRAALARSITGNPMPTAKAEQAAREAQAYAADKFKDAKVQVAVPGDLAGAVRAMADVVVATNAERDQAKAATAAAVDAAAKTTAERDAMLKDKDTKIAEASDARDKAMAEIEEWRKAKGVDIVKIQADAEQKVKDYQAAAEKTQAASSKVATENKDLKKQLDAALGRLATMRINTKEPIVQQADGKIIRLPSNDTVFINIGQQDNVTPGLTFEVYDKNKGIPALGDGLRDGDLPVGKASIEVTHVLPGSSECRVIKHTPGQSLTEGDLIMNLVYDPHHKYNFVVYGNFDLNQTGNATPGDAEVMKRLVTQWGGRLMNTVNVDTDFVVMGKEPVVSVLTKDDENDAQKQHEHDVAQAALDAYGDIRAKAIQYGVPIMNQNRFLYFVGYYELAKR